MEWSVEWSVDCQLLTVECRVRSVGWGAGSVEHRLWSVRPWTVECGV